MKRTGVLTAIRLMSDELQNPNSAVSIDGYTLIRRDQCRGGGGVAI